MSEILISCPFCGGEGQITTQLLADTFVWCKRCHARTKKLDTREEAITAWSRRAPEPMMQDEQQEGNALRVLVQSLKDCRKEYQKKFVRVCTSPGDTHYVALSFAGDVMTLLAAYDRLPEEDAK